MANKLEFSAFEGLVTATQERSTNAKYTSDDVALYLGNVYKYGNKLRQMSDWFYYNNGIYRNIVNSFANLPTLDHLILPSSYTLDKIEDKSYNVYLGKVNQYAETINIKTSTRRILKSLARYGGFVGYERTNGKEFYIQTLPLDYCRIKYKMGNDYQMEFNFKYFDKFWDKEDLDLAWTVYPKEFKGLYNKYKKDGKSKNPEWQMMDIKKTWCIPAEDDEPLFIPMYSGMFKSLISNEDYKDLIKVGKELDISKLLVQKVPVDKDGNLLISKDQVKMFHQELKKVLPTGANATTTPMELNSVSFSNATKDNENLLSKAEREVFVNSGTSSSLFADNGGNVALNINIETVTANIYALLEKVEDLFGRKFLQVVSTKNYVFKLKFFRTTNVNINENFERMYKMVSIGGAITPLFSLMGFDTETYTSLLTVENSLGIKTLLTPVQSIHTQTGDTSAEQKPVGKPKSEDKDLSNEGAKAKDLDTNNPLNR